MLREYARVTALKQKLQPGSGKNGQTLNISLRDRAGLPTEHGGIETPCNRPASFRRVPGCAIHRAAAMA
jgi:hypothetical protein